MRYCAYCVDGALTGRYVTWLPGAQLQCWMLLTVYTLPQLAVSAKILCLLMVVICGAVPSMVRSVRLYNQCSHGYMSVLHNGTVMAFAGENDQPNLTISTRGVSLELLIYSPVHNMFLCFNRSKLVGIRMTRAQAERTDKCLFIEEFVGGWNRYHLVKYPDRYIGFNRRGVQLRRGKSRISERQQKCLSFMKKSQEGFDINKHNSILGGERPPRPWLQRRAEVILRNSIPPNQNPRPERKLKNRCRIRHHRRGLQGVNCT